MELKRKEKLKRKPKEPLPEIDLFIESPHGGFMPYPPPDCISPRIHIDKNTNIPFVDFVLCAIKCSKNNFCQRHREYRAYHKKQKETKLERKGE